MRSLLSLTAPSGSPTRVKAGEAGGEVGVDADLGSVEAIPGERVGTVWDSRAAKRPMQIWDVRPVLA